MRRDRNVEDQQIIGNSESLKLQKVLILKIPVRWYLTTAIPSWQP